MTIYQIYVQGSSTLFDSKFKMHSKKVYINYPSKEEIDDFIKLCTDEKYLVSYTLQNCLANVGIISINNTAIIEINFFIISLLLNSIFFHNLFS